MTTLKANDSRKRKSCPFSHKTRAHNGLQDRKLIYQSREEAMLVIEQMNHGAVISREKLEAYQCKHASHWHIGRSSKVNEFQEEWERLQQSLRKIPKVGRN